MFELVSWGFRLVYVFLVLGFAFCSYLIHFKKKTGLGWLLPFINIIFIAANFAISMFNSDFTDMMPLLVGAFLMVSYLLFRILIAVLYKPENMLLYDLPALLTSIGVSMLYLLNPEYGIKQLAFISIGSIALIFVFSIMEKIDIKPKYALFFGLTILFFLVLTQFAGTQINGSRNWIRISFFKFQPSEVLKIFYVYYLACLLHKELSLKKFIAVFSSVVLVALFFAMQRDLGSAFIFFTIFLIMLVMSDSKLYYTVVSAGAAMVGAVISYFTFSHIRSRIIAWADPWKYVSDKSYQITQSLFAVATGGLLGTGLYLGKPGFIPAVHTDFIFSAICEETGILSAIGIIIIYILLTLIGLSIARNCKNEIDRLAAIGLASLTAVQTLLIISGVLNLIPITGVTLPFVSYGGTSILSQFINLGLLFYLQKKGGGAQNET